jgi:hypothetical protein
MRRVIVLAVLMTTGGIGVVVTAQAPAASGASRSVRSSIRRRMADHVSGIVAFPASIEVVTHANTKGNMEAMRTYTGQTEPPRDVCKENMGKGLPTRTREDRTNPCRDSLNTARRAIEYSYARLMGPR